MEPRIPKRIIQTGKRMELPVPEKVSATNIKLLNPEYEYVFFDDRKVEAFMQEQPAIYRETFQSFRFTIQKFDFFRYLAIYELGGFYFDLDVFLAENLSRLEGFECIFPFEELTSNSFLIDKCKMDYEIGNYAFGAAPKHPFIKAIIDNCVRAQQDQSWAEPLLQGIPRLFREHVLVLNTTGPGLVTRTFAENKQLAHNVKILFPKDVLDTKMWHRFGEFGFHAMAGSWRSSKSRLTNFLYQKWLEGKKLKLARESTQLGQNRKPSYAVCL